MIGCPRSSVSFLLRGRIKTSAPPPGGNGTIILMGFEGYSSANEEAFKKLKAIRNTTLKKLFFILSLFVFIVKTYFMKSILATLFGLMTLDPDNTFKYKNLKIKT